MHFAFRSLMAAGLAGALPLGVAFATNPLIMDQFTADPTARVFNGRMYLYPSHDILAAPGKGRPGWFCMEDYHVFSSDNLTDWQDHGVIIRQTEVPWADPAAYSMWAPDCVEKAGRYYFFFPAPPKGEKRFTIGVAVADAPEGPFQPESTPIAGVQGIDPCVFIDRDGSPYLFYSSKKIFVAKLKDSMRELAGDPAVIANLPEKGLLEGPFVFERNGVYYLTYPHVENKIERLEYATASHALGPFKPAGVILDESASGCWTVHHSIVEYRGQWYLFYHDRDLSPDFDKARSVRADRLFFNEDGTIQKVVPTLRGVGVVAAKNRIQLDRYSATSGASVVVSALDPARLQEGWKISLAGVGSWVRFNEVDFARGGLQSVNLQATSPTGATVEIHLDDIRGPVLARIEVGAGPDWQIHPARVAHSPSGIHDLVVTQAGGNGIDLDWISFQ